MKSFDVLVIGSGSGGEIVDAAITHGFSTAWVDKGPLGGTCLNVGCIPSKMLVYPADRIMDILQAQSLGITAKITAIDFQEIMAHMRKPITESHRHMTQGLQQPIDNFEYFKGLGTFIKPYTLDINGEHISGKKIFIGSGARPFIPPIPGLDLVPYLTNETVFDMQHQPKSMIILGGGYIAAEFAHFFSAIGTKVRIIHRSNRILRTAEPEIAELLLRIMESRMSVIKNFRISKIFSSKQKISVEGTDAISGKSHTYSAETIFVATGRQSNADRLQVEKTGVETDDRGYIQVNEYMETSRKNIWAFGDATGKYLFKHVANEEAVVAWNNAVHEQKSPMQYHAVPYAVFTYPQIAGVGLREEEAKQHHNIVVGTAKYNDVAKGEAMAELDGFAKAIVDKQDHTILGFHIIGPYAPILIQEVVNAMALGGKLGFLGQGMHIHPALPELILRTFGNLHDPS